MSAISSHFPPRLFPIVSVSTLLASVILLLDSMSCTVNATQFVEYRYDDPACSHPASMQKIKNSTANVCLPEGELTSQRYSCPTTEEYSCASMAFYTTASCTVRTGQVLSIVADMCQLMSVERGYYRFSSDIKRFEMGCDKQCTTCYTTLDFEGNYGTCWALSVPGTLTEYVVVDAIAPCALSRLQIWASSSSCVGAPVIDANIVINKCLQGAIYSCETDSGASVASSTSRSGGVNAFFIAAVTFWLVLASLFLS